MKIAIFSDCYLDLTGGIVSSINSQKKALEARGHDVYIFSTGYLRSSQKLASLAKRKIFVVPSCKFFLRGLTPVSRRPRIIEQWLLRKHPEIRDFDIFYIHYEAGCSIAGLRLGRELNIPTIQVMHGREDVGEANLIPFGFRTIVAWTLNQIHSRYLPHSIKIRRDNYLANTFAKASMWTMMINHANTADLVLTPSAHFREKLLHYGVNKKILVFPNGFDDAKFIPEAEIRTFSPGDKLRIIWHSRVSGEKRIIPFLKALTKVKGAYVIDIFGNGNDLARAKRYARHHQLNANFHGDAKFDNLKHAISRAHLDVLASYDYDTFGMTLIEAEAYGTPVLFCDPDMAEIVPSGSFILTKSPNPQHIASAIDSLISHPNKIHEMSSIMIEHRQEVLISRRIITLEKIFNDIIKK